MSKACVILGPCVVTIGGQSWSFDGSKSRSGIPIKAPCNSPEIPHKSGSNLCQLPASVQKAAQTSINRDESS